MKGNKFESRTREPLRAVEQIRLQAEVMLKRSPDEALGDVDDELLIEPLVEPLIELLGDALGELLGGPLSDALGKPIDALREMLQLTSDGSI